jgi:hypothetical protein
MERIGGSEGIQPTPITRRQAAQLGGRPRPHRQAARRRRPARPARRTCSRQRTRAARAARAATAPVDRRRHRRRRARRTPSHLHPGAVRVRRPGVAAGRVSRPRHLPVAADPVFRPSLPRSLPRGLRPVLRPVTAASLQARAGRLPVRSRATSRPASSAIPAAATTDADASGAWAGGLDRQSAEAVSGRDRARAARGGRRRAPAWTRRPAHERAPAPRRAPARARRAAH